jgi:hypothetical protein
MMHCMAQHLVHYRGAGLASRRCTPSGIGQSCLRSITWSGGGLWVACGGGSESRILCLPQVKEQQMQAEYQTHLKEQYYLDQIKKDKEESQVSLEGANERLEGVKRTKEAQGREASEVMQAMEVAHMRAAEELENLYERKLAAEAARFEALRQEKEDMQCQFEVCALAPHTCVSWGMEARRAPKLLRAAAGAAIWVA